MRRVIHITEEAAADLREMVRLGYEIRNDFDHAYELLEAGKPLFGFDDHELKGQLQGWRAFAVGLQTSVSAPRANQLQINGVRHD